MGNKCFNRLLKAAIPLVIEIPENETVSRYLVKYPDLNIGEIRVYKANKPRAQPFVIIGLKKGFANIVVFEDGEKRLFSNTGEVEQITDAILQSACTEIAKMLIQFTEEWEEAVAILDYQQSKT